MNRPSCPHWTPICPCCPSRSPPCPSGRRLPAHRSPWEIVGKPAHQSHRKIREKLRNRIWLAETNSHYRDLHEWELKFAYRYVFKINLCTFLFDSSLKFFMEVEPLWFSPPQVTHKALKQKLKDLPRATDFFKFTNFGEGGRGRCTWHAPSTLMAATTKISTHTDASLNKKQDFNSKLIEPRARVCIIPVTSATTGQTVVCHFPPAERF